MQTLSIAARRAALPTKLPAIFRDMIEVPAKPAKLELQNGKRYNIQRTTPNGTVLEPEVAKFYSKNCNPIISDRWVIKGRVTYVNNGPSVKVLSRV